MQSSDWTSPLYSKDQGKKSPFTLCLLLAVAIAAPNAIAQSVVSAPPAVSYVPPALSQAPATDSILPGFWNTSLLQWGPVLLHPHLSYRFLYGDGIQASPGKQTTTSVNTVSLGVLATLGDHWSLDYTPSKTFYSDPSFKDSFDQSLNLAGGTSFEKWTFRVGQSYTSVSSPLIETGRQTKEDDFGTTASADYSFTDRIQLDTTLGYQSRSAESFTDSKDSTISERLHYRFSPRVDTSFSTEYGYSNVSSGTDMSYTRPAVELDWKPTEKISLGAHGGFENRRFHTGGADSLNTPTYGASIQYRPFTTTSVNFSAERGVSTAYFADQITRNTNWTVGLNQRLLQHYYFSAAYAGQKASYLSTDPSLAVARDDRNYSLNLRLGTTFFQRAAVSVTYQNTHNTSNTPGFGFTSSQVGFELGYQF